MLPAAAIRLSVPRAGATSDRPCSQNGGGLLIEFPSCVTSPSATANSAAASSASEMVSACALRSEHSPSLDAAPSPSMWAAVSTSLWGHLSVGLCLDWLTGCEPESYASPDRWKQLQRAPGSPVARAQCDHDDDIRSRWDDDEDWGPCYTPPLGHRTIAANPRSALRTPGSTASRRSAAAALRSVSFSCDKVREFETVEGQEWWHNDARSSQAAPLDVSCMPAELCACGGADGRHGTECCWRMP